MTIFLGRKTEYNFYLRFLKYRYEISSYVVINSIICHSSFCRISNYANWKGTLDVKLTHDMIQPNIQTKINIDFINPQTQKIQEHVDYTISVLKDGEMVFEIANNPHIVYKLYDCNFDDFRRMLPIGNNNYNIYNRIAYSL